MNTALSNSAQLITWDIRDRKQIEQAKTHYRRARAEGRKIVCEDDRVLESFTADLGGFRIREKEIADHEFALRIFDETGDRRLIWNSNDPFQVKDAAKLFDQYLKKGWKAYAVDSEGKRGRRIFGFNGEHEEVYFDEKGTGVKLKKFLESFKQVTVVPKTFPG